jgi:hypothetical protein
LRAKLGELSNAAREASNGAPAQPILGDDTAIAATRLQHVPEPEPRPIKH